MRSLGNVQDQVAFPLPFADLLNRGSTEHCAMSSCVARTVEARKRYAMNRGKLPFSVSLVCGRFSALGASMLRRGSDSVTLIGPSSKFWRLKAVAGRDSPGRRT